MKKFLVSFLVIFAISFGLINFRFIAAQARYYLETPNPASEKGWTLNFKEGPTLDTRVLPISNSRYFFLEIPSLGVKAPIILEKSTDPNKVFQRLENGVVHYADTPLPGEKGAALILGHSSAYPWYKGKYGSVFALLGKLKEGDIFYVNNGDKTFSYQITGSLVFNPFNPDEEQLAQMEETDGSSLVLVSCWPVGTDFKRIAIKADLIN